MRRTGKRWSDPTIGKDGAGRGLGLFLTGNVMRRLDGEMRLANLAHGAQVTMTLPTLETAA